MTIRRIIGTAGWSISGELSGRFSGVGSALARYASVFDGVEVNSSFYRHHRQSTWANWHDAVPAHFRFAVKLPRTITHVRQLTDAAEEIATFADEIAPLGDKLGPVLVQLPPSLAFERARAAVFFTQLRQRIAGQVVIEPRHISWGLPDADAVLAQSDIGRVYADPQKLELRREPRNRSFTYLRLHGAPRVYFSAYSPRDLGEYAEIMRAAQADIWCIFDNTASGAALRNGLDLRAMLART
ncbi:MAG: DUF72 domain-containing protein [Devosia sp.]|jgi:uncharacterized protein YecE (DUF72 family)|uniref:DUF72 domain-containing protein n=1 Tax=Devosia sp. TaxID=1871048 RepID=UPI001A01BBC5|nr:DUF72 domain-containing protein [Devosia sp.]MBF0679533.1 DUF72 domain-containing protein [Devosia sp.]